MLRFRRPSGSKSAAAFGRKFLAPVFGPADADGNYYMKIGNQPRIMFTAHYDTVHFEGGVQKVAVSDGFARLAEKSSCLGADCTSGIWLILQMIRAEVPGAYAVFADEEIGCVGSSAFLRNYPQNLDGIEAVISFDRKGVSSVVTHQQGVRTASDAFAISLADILGMNMNPDPHGVYTDSCVFKEIVPECTNLSVGYFSAHSSEETQDLEFLRELSLALISADWSEIVIERNPMDYDSRHFDYREDDGWKSDYIKELDLAEFISNYPEIAARFIVDCGFDIADLKEYAQDHRRYSDFN